MKCFKCLKDVPAGAQTCPYCGDPLTLKSEQVQTNADRPVPEQITNDQSPVDQSGSGQSASAEATIDQSTPAQAGNAQTPRPPELKQYQAGDIIKDRYEVQAILGTTGVGNTYKVKDNKGEKIVVLKQIRPSLLASRGTKERLLNNLKKLTTLGPGEIAAVYEYGEDEGTVYFVTEYIEGLPLRKLLDVRKEAKQFFMGEELTSLLTPVCKALIAMHNKGIVHGNLKPDNIFLLPDCVRVTDAGIAGAMSSRDFTAIQRDLENAYKYIAPEVALGGAMSKASDIYSLGTIVYEMLTGVIPERPLIPPTTHNKDLPGHIDETVLKALQEYRTQRIQTVTEFYTGVVESFGQKAAEMEEAIEHPEQQTDVEKAKKIQAEVIKEILTEKGARQLETDKTTKLPAFIKDAPQAAIVVTMFVLLVAFIAWLWFKPLYKMTGKPTNAPPPGIDYVPPSNQSP